MKKAYLLLAIAALLFCLYSCKKDNSPATFTGRWNIVSDSSYTNAPPYSHPVNYAGKPGDYFNITTNGTIYTKEGAVLDTLTYSLSSATTVLIQPFGIVYNYLPETSNITMLTSNTLVIVAPVVVIPGGLFSPGTTFDRKITLSR
jgi:hypothetical protein